MTGFTDADISATGGTLASISADDNGITFRATFTPAATYDGPATIRVGDRTYSDLHNNEGAGDVFRLTIATTTPTLAITAPDTRLIAGETTTVTFGFSEAVTGFTDADISATGGTLSRISADDNGITFRATFTPAATYDGPATIRVGDSTYSDLHNNEGAGDVFRLTIATTTPTLAITAPDTSLIAGETTTVTFGFSEAVTGFTDADISATGGTLSRISADDNGITFRATFIPAATYDGPATIRVGDSTYSDLHNNEGAGDVFRLTIATTTPTLAITAPDTSLIAGETTTVTFGFSEAVTGFTDADISATGGTLSRISADDNGITFRATFIPAATYDGPATIRVGDRTYSDLHNNEGAGDVFRLTIDTTTPTLAITAPDTNLIGGETTIVTFGFSEAVTGFTDADISATGGTLASIITNDNGITFRATYTATFTPEPDYNGPATIRVGHSAYSDLHNNEGTGHALHLTIETIAPALDTTRFDHRITSPTDDGDASDTDVNPTPTILELIRELNQTENVFDGIDQLPPTSPVSLIAPLTDQQVTASGAQYDIWDLFGHTDDMPLWFTASLISGNLLPYYVQFDSETGIFEFDAAAAAEVGASSLQIRIIAVDPDGNQASGVFRVDFQNIDESHRRQHGRQHRRQHGRRPRRSLRFS